MKRLRPLDMPADTPQKDIPDFVLMFIVADTVDGKDVTHRVVVCTECGSLSLEGETFAAHKAWHSSAAFDNMFGPLGI
jgi:hypothetical protein